MCGCIGDTVFQMQLCAYYSDGHSIVKCVTFGESLPLPGQTGKGVSFLFFYPCSLSSVHLSVNKLGHNILKTNKPILMQIGSGGPQGKST